MTVTVNYEAFLPYIAPAIQPKEKTTASLSETEIRATVASAFKEAITQVAEDTGGYSVKVPVHLYQDLKDYQLELPDGYTLRKVNRVYENHAKWPKAAYFDDTTLHLPCCAEATINNAFTLDVGVVPDPVSDVCEFDKSFVNMYFHVILAYMRYTLSMQAARQWASLGHADRLHQMYKKQVKQHKNKAIQGLITIKSERLTDASYPRRTTTNTNDAYDTGAEGCSTCPNG